MKTIAPLSVLIVSLMFTAVHAKDTLVADPEPRQPQTKVEQHIDWHEFKHELISFPRVTANMSHDGVVTLFGLVSTYTQKKEVEELASRVKGATQIINRTGTK